MVTYQVDLQDSILTFDSNISFKPDAIFRGQELEMTLFIPYHTYLTCILQSTPYENLPTAVDRDCSFSHNTYITQNP